MQKAALLFFVGVSFAIGIQVAECVDTVPAARAVGGHEVTAVINGTTGVDGSGCNAHIIGAEVANDVGQLMAGWESTCFSSGNIIVTVLELDAGNAWTAAVFDDNSCCVDSVDTDGCSQPPPDWESNSHDTGSVEIEEVEDLELAIVTDTF